MRITVLIGLLFWMSGCALTAGNGRAPFADIHLHYNWDQEELVGPQQALEILRKNNVELAVVFSTPTDNALKLVNRDHPRVIPIFSPYTSVRGRDTWFHDKKVLKLAREGLEQKIWQGIGELHVVSGIGPRRDNEVFQGLLKLAAEFNVPFIIHTEASSYKFLLPICQQYVTVRFLWVHAGGILGPDHAEAIIKECPNVWIDMSARDPWHYGGLVNEHGSLLKGWRDVFIKYSDRFMTGTDPVWNAHERHRWHEADEGWLHYKGFINFHRKWLAELPEAVEKKIRLQNALQFFERPDK